MDTCPTQGFRKARKAHIRDFRAKVGNLGTKVFRSKPLWFYVSFSSAIQLGTPCPRWVSWRFFLTFSCEISGCWVGLWGRSVVQGSRFGVSHIVFLGKVGLGVPKLGHRCALKLWKGSGRKPGEDKEGIWIWVERFDCDWTTWEDSELPSLRTKSQVDSSGKYYPLTTNRPRAIRFRSL